MVKSLEKVFEEASTLPENLQEQLAKDFAENINERKLVAELRKKATGDFAKFNDDTLLAIHESGNDINDINMTKCKDLEDFKQILFSNDD